MLCVALLGAAAPAARAQLNLNPFANYYNNIPRAAQANDVAKIRSLLADGTSPNQTDENGGTTGLHVAASIGNLQIIAILYKAGGDINQRDAVGSSPLDYAAEHDRLEAVKLLIEMKARINDQNQNGMTALMFAARTGDVEMVRTLLAGGANPHILDYTGRDAAGWALDSHRPNVIRLLKNTH
jgi:ankyrin repeat protein